MLINLPTGKTISLTTYEWLFILKEEDVDSFYQSCIADDLGHEMNNPFSKSESHFLNVQEEFEEE